MVNPKKNLICEEIRLGKIKECWRCKCGKHHMNKDGARFCCSKVISMSCNCRHCDLRRNNLSLDKQIINNLIWKKEKKD